MSPRAGVPGAAPAGGNPPRLDPKRLPRHIAIIMDGNGRWAKRRGLPRVFGHRAGATAVRTAVQAASDLGIGVLTVYAFSTENWSRPAGEIRALMAILSRFLRSERPRLIKQNIRFRAIGDVSQLPAAQRRELDLTIRETASCTGLTFQVAINYGGRQELVRAVNSLINDGGEPVDEESITGRLDTAGLPDPDLLIRTSGEQRISNFLLWQIAYAELYFTPVLWPDFTAAHMSAAIAEYQSRSRRYGGLQ